MALELFARFAAGFDAGSFLTGSFFCWGVTAAGEAGAATVFLRGVIVDFLGAGVDGSETSASGLGFFCLGLGLGLGLAGVWSLSST